MSGVAITGMDWLKSERFTTALTDASGVTTYDTGVPVDVYLGQHSVSFTASKAGFAKSGEAAGQVTVAQQPLQPLRIDKISPYYFETVNVGQSQTYTFTVIDFGGRTSGAVVSGWDEVTGKTFTTGPTDANGETTYVTTAAPGTRPGFYHLTFTAHKAGNSASRRLDSFLTVR